MTKAQSFIAVGMLVAALMAAVALYTYKSNYTASPSVKDGTTIRVGHLIALDMAPLFVAQEAGYFEEEGLEVELEFFTDVFENNAALASGEIDFSINPFTLPYFDLVNGIPVRTISAAGGWGVIEVIIQGEYEVYTMEELAEYVQSHPGQKLKVVSFQGDTLDLILYDAFAELGLSYDDFEMIWANDLLEMVEIFREGEGDILSHIRPYTTDLVVNSGAQVLTNNAEVWSLHTPNTVLSVLDGTLRDQPEVVEAYFRAVIKAADLINNSPEEAVALMENADYPNYYQVSYEVVLEAFKTQVAPITFTPDVDAINASMFKLKELGYLDIYVPGRDIFRLDIIEQLESQ